MTVRPQVTDRSARRLLLFAAAATAALGAALAAGWEPGIPGEWAWRRSALPVRLLPAVPPAGGLVLLAFLVCRPGRWERMRGGVRAALLLALAALVLALQCALLNAVGVPWVAPGAIVASPPATTYFAVALDVQRPGDWLAGYDEHMRQLPHHAATHPPGFGLLFWAIQRLCETLIPEPSPWLAAVAESYQVFGIAPTPQDAAAAMASAVAIASVGALGLIPLYLLVRQLSGPGAAVRTSCLAGSMPGLLLLGASPDLVVLTLAITVLCIGYLAWRRGSAPLGLLAGLALAFGMFFSLALALVGVWALLWLLVGVLRCSGRSAGLRRALLGLVSAAVGFVLFYAALRLAWGYQPVAVVREALSAHRDVTTAAFARTYWKWLLMNPVECAIFAGLPLTLAAIWGWWGCTRDAQMGRLWPFLASWLAVFVLLDLSGWVRGEVGRIWLFLLWPAAVAAGARLAVRPEGAGAISLLVLLQTAQAVLMRGYMTVYDIL